MTIIEIPVTHTFDLRKMPAWLLDRQLGRAIPHLRRGDIIEVWTTDAAASSAVETWAANTGHRLVGIESRDGYDEIFVEVGR